MMIVWNGGDRDVLPVGINKDDLLQVKLRNRELVIGPAYEFDWEHIDDDNDIVEYEVIASYK